MDTPHPETLVHTSQRPDAASRRQERRRPKTTQEAREQALQGQILTDAGFAQGYVVLQPSRWLWRFWLELERFNSALQRVETHTFTLLGNRQTDFLPHLQAFQAVLDDYRATTRRLTQHAHTLASGRVKDLAPLTQQVVDAWRDDPSPRLRGDDPSPDDLPPDALAAADPLPAAPAGVEPPAPVPDLTTFFGPSLAEERAAARVETA
jgi:hypothetical protein